jgi:hypothetical protein
MAKLGILVVHGMGNQTSTFADGMKAEMSRRLAHLKINPDEIIWKPVYWAPVMQKREEKLLGDLLRGGPLDYYKLRCFVLYNLADAVAFQKAPSDHEAINVYEEVTEKIRSSVAELEAELNASDPSRSVFPVLVFAHSLGCHIASSYIWDIQSKNERAAQVNTPFEQMQTLAGFVTFGNNMPLFTLVYDKILPINFPGAAVTDCFPAETPSTDIKAACQWLNFYDPDDILGYPLKTLSVEYGETITKDIPINVGGILSSWNPGSHNGYWTDDDMLYPVSLMLEKILKLL